MTTEAAGHRRRGQRPPPPWIGRWQTRTGFSIRANLVVTGTLFGFLAIMLVAEQGRFLSGTPAFGLLFTITSPRMWAIPWFVVAAAYALGSIRFPALAPYALIAGMMLNAVWATAFWMRFLTDSATPPTSAIAWTLIAYYQVHELLRLNKLMTGQDAADLGVCCQPPVEAPNDDDRNGTIPGFGV